MIENVKKVFANLFKEGFYVTYRKIKKKIKGGNSFHTAVDEAGNTGSSKKSVYLNPNLMLPEKKPALNKFPADKRMVWFVPEFSEGSGGHRTILRHISYYEQQGLYADVYVFYQNIWGNTERTRKNILKYFDIELKHAEFFELTLGEVDAQIKKDYSIAMATSWESAYIAANFSRCFKKMYFVQDFEPMFFAKGRLYHFAAATYHFKFDKALTAGDWLKKLMEEQYGIPAVSFGFGYDKNIYQDLPKKNSSDVKTIFYYARPITERRGFELAVQVLYTLAQKRKDIRIITAGWDLSVYNLPFVYENHKKVSPSQLAQLYRESDVALVLSMTNLSLLPYEVAASGCPVLMNDGPNTEWIDPDKKIFFFSKATVSAFVRSIEYILDTPEEIEKRKAVVKEHLEMISWEAEIKKCYTALQEVLTKDNL